MRRRRMWLALTVVAAIMRVSPWPADAASDDTDEGGGIWDILEEQRQASATVVSATQREETVADSPAIVSVIDEYEIAARGYRSVAEALRAVPGLFVTDDGVLPDVSVRGINGGLRGWSSLIKVMINGQPTAFRPDTTNFLGPEFLPIEIVRRIEIIRGPVSALYGPNAFLGIVQIITKEPSKAIAGSERTTGYLVNDRRPGIGGSLVLSHAQGAFSVLGALATERLDRSGLSVARTSPAQNLGIGATSDNDIAWPKTFYTQLKLDAAKAGSFWLDGHVQHLDTAAEFSDWSLASHVNRLSVINGYGRLRWEGRFGERWSSSAFVAIQVGAALPNEHLAVSAPDHFLKRALGGRELSVGADASYHFRERDEILVGFSLNQEWQDRLGYTSVFLTDGAQNRAGDEVRIDAPQLLQFTNVGPRVQALIYPWAWLGVIGALRYDYHTAYGSSVSPRAGLVATVSPRVSLKLLYGRSFKAPSGVQLQARPGLSSADLFGNPLLKPQVADTVELGVVTNPTTWLKLNATGFFSHIGQQIAFEQAGFGIQARNSGRTISAGVEAEARVGTRRVDAFLNGVYNHTLSATAINLALGYDERFRTTPAWTAASGVHGRWPEAYLQGYVEVRVMGDRSASQKNASVASVETYLLPPAVAIDLALSSMELKFRGSEFQLTFRVQNLLDMRPAIAGYAGYDIPSRGRSFELSLTHRF